MIKFYRMMAYEHPNSAGEEVRINLSMRSPQMSCNDLAGCPIP